MKKLYPQFLQIIFCFFLLIGCSSPAFLSGKYGAWHNPNSFVFATDSTFTYEYTDPWYKESSGRWIKKGNKIYLNSFVQEDKMPIRFAKMKTKTNTEDLIVRINLQTQNQNDTDYICIPFVNKKSLILHPEKGSYSFESKVSIDSLSLLVFKDPFVLSGTESKSCFDPIPTEQIKVKSFIGDSLNITVTIIDSLFSYQVFRNKELAISKGKILFKKAGKNNSLNLKK
jgi:hypothetical protein